MSKTNFSSENSDGLNNENNNIGEYLNVNSFNLYVDTVSTLFQKGITNVDYNIKKSTKLTGNLIKWEIYLDDSKIELSFFKKINIKWKCINMRVEMSTYFYNHGLIVSSLFNNDIVILTTFGILIFTFSENNGISLNYFYSMKLKNYGNSKEYIKTLKHYKSIFSKSTLPSPNYDSFRLPMWVSDLRNNMSSLLKYDAELLTFAIKEHELELIKDIYEKTRNNKSSLLKYGVDSLTHAIKVHDLELINDIYKNCMTYFKEDLMNNKSFLSIITSTMPLLNEYYPEYILKYSSETNMIIYSSFYIKKNRNKNLVHLYPFIQSPQIANLSQSLLWTKYHYKLYCIFGYTDLLFLIICATQALIILITLPFYLATFYILSKYDFINNIYIMDAFSIVYFYIPSIIKFFKKNIVTTIPTITFMVPYINFVNYSKDYNWFLELIKPQP
ncbi:hypothetical protein RhiirA1_471700, partial [Rhizophagus irregularis]